MIGRSIADARDLQELRVAVARLLPALVALHDAEVGARQISAIMAAVMDAAVRRLMDLRLAEEPVLPSPGCRWAALVAEAAPASDVDSAVAWREEAPGLERLRPRGRGGAGAGGIARDFHGATAGSPLFARSADEWRSAIRHWLEHPGRRRR